MTLARSGSRGNLLLSLGMALSVAAGITGVRPSAAAAAPSSDLASELITAVNAFRAGYGMAPLVVDPILMLVEQAQNNYSMSIGQITHYGPTGARPRDRATAAGYGGGATIFASENIAMGTGLTPAGAVQVWTGDEPHLNTMLGQYYRDIGAGAGEEGGVYYYTLITAYVAGGHSARSTVPVGGLDIPGASLARPVVRATAAQDGSIVHVVETGQTLWTIAAVYAVELEKLLSLNGLTEQALLHPGDRLIVQAAATATLTPAPTATEGPTPTRTAGPTRRPTTARTPTPSAAVAGFDIDSSTLFAVWAVVVLILGLVFAVRRL